MLERLIEKMSVEYYHRDEIDKFLQLWGVVGTINDTSLTHQGC